MQHDILFNIHLYWLALSAPDEGMQAWISVYQFTSLPILRVLAELWEWFVTVVYGHTYILMLTVLKVDTEDCE
jgi:hypothetical protein